MDGPERRSGVRAGGGPDGWIRESYSQILTNCVCAGLTPSDAEDVAQDIWLWLLRQGPPAMVFSMPWLAAVTRNFILRHRRKSYRRYLREGRALTAIPEPGSAEALAKIEIKELLDRTAAELPEAERRLLALIRAGHTLAESARLLGIPRGSRAYYHARLIACARRELQFRTTIPVRTAYPMFDDVERH